MCIGNRDGIGPYIADTMKKVSQNNTVLDCGITPENYTAVVKQKNQQHLF
jgi:Ni,Fe-hydrogenase maturation factor